MNLFNKIINYLEKVKDLPPLLFRMVLAYGFYGTAMMKLKNFDGIVEWFSSMGMPLPKLNAFLATGTETAGVMLLFLGLATRIISVPLIIVMIVAIMTVHLGNGFEAGNNGSEIPIYYILMLLSLLISGPGKISIDSLIAKFYNKNS
ncbi:MAG: DoxX family membrane protein [Planctomycetia bacterium]|nr:DoxX family membrane protein [Planctomycetia bacterium]